MRSAVITTVAGRLRHLAAQRAVVRTLRGGPDLHVVVALGDPSVLPAVSEEGTDGLDSGALETIGVEISAGPDGLPLAAGRNAGAAAAIGTGAELLIFLDVDCLPGAELVATYARAAQRQPDALLCGPVTYLPPTPVAGWQPADLVRLRSPHRARPDPEPGDLLEAADPALFWSLSFAVTSATWERIGGFDEGFVGYGAEDTDFARRAVRCGVPMLWVGGADAFHQHHPTNSPPVQHVDAIVRNGAHYAQRWGEWPMGGWLEGFERLGLVRGEGASWRRAAPVRVASVPAVHPYVDAVHPRGAEAVRRDRVVGWEPDPLLDRAYLRSVAEDIDVVHLHFGYDSLAPAELDRWLVEVRRLGLPLVVTVHDLRNPHHAEPHRHERHLRSLLRAADEVMTISDAAAEEIRERFGRDALVVPHPTLLDERPVVSGGAVTAPLPTVLVPLKSLRRNVCQPAELVAATVAGAETVGGRVRVDVHPDAVADERLSGVRDLAAAGRLDLCVHERYDDAQLVRELAGMHALVLPYRFGTHSGWIELARDVGTRVITPSCGHYGRQWNETVGYGNDERHGLSADSLTKAVAQALSEPRPAPAERSERLAEREQGRAAHEIVYRRAVSR